MTFCGNIVCLRPRSVICGPSAARDANDTIRAQINNIPEKSHFIIIIINIQGHIISRYLTSFVQFLMNTSRSQYIELKIQNHSYCFCFCFLLRFEFGSVFGFGFVFGFAVND